MNKVFKTIWNASLGAWVAVSEAASGQKKSSNKLIKSSINAVATMVIGVAAQTTIAGWAPTELGTTDPTKLLGDIGTDSIAIGSSTVVGDGKANASGPNAIAIGKNATANQTNSMALGTNSKAVGPNSTSFGSGAVSSATGTVAIGTGASAGDGAGNGSGQGAIAIGASAVAKNQGSIAIGKGTEVNEDNAIAIGSGAISAKNAVVVGVGSIGVAGAVSLNGTATGDNAVSIGTNSDAKYNNAVAVGYKARAALSAVGIGNDAFAYATDSIAIGSSNVVNAVSGIGSVAIGRDNLVSAQDTFVLGSRVSTTVANSVVLGLDSELSRVNTAVNNPSVGYLDAQGNAQTKTYNHTYAGAPAVAKGAVSVGAPGAERQIQNVAAGRVNAASTDAVNGSQLYAVLSEVNDLDQKSGWNVAVNDGEKTLIKDKDDTVNFKAGSNINLSKANRTDGADITVNLADSIALTNAGSVVIAGGVGSLGPIQLKQGNVSFGGNQLHGVAEGVADTDAVNVAQLKSSSWAVETTNGTTNIKKDDAVGFYGDKNITVIQKQGGQGTDLSIELAKDLDLTPDGSVKAGDTTLNGKGLTLTNGPSVTTSGINAGDKVVTGVADGLIADNSKEAINGGQLKKMIDNDTLYGWSLATTDKADPTQVKNANTVGFNGDKNLSVKQEERKDKDGKVIGTDILVELEKDLDLSKDGSLTVGGTVLNNGGLSIAAGGGRTPIIIQQGNVSFGGNQLKNVAEGTDDTDAVNVSQLNKVINGNYGWSIETSEKSTPTQVKNSHTVGFKGDNNISVTQAERKDDKGNVVGTDLLVELKKDIDLGKDGSISIGGINIQEGNISVGGNTINNVTAATEGHQAVNLDQLNQVTGDLGWNVKGTDSTGKAVTEKITNNETVEFSAGKNINVNTTGTGNGASITVELAKDLDITDGSLKAGDVVINNGGIHAGDKVITGVADGKIEAGSKDAVNGGQILDLIDTISSSSWDIVGIDSKGEAVDKTIKTGNKVEFKPGSSNIVVNTNATDQGAEVSVDLARDLSVDSINVGGTVNINKGGIDAGNTIIKNIADGKSPNDAVNVSQLDKTNTYVTNVFGGGSSYNPTTQEFTGPTYNVAGGSYNNVGDALEAIDDRIDNTYNYMDNIKKKMSAGIASAMALEAAPFIAGKYTYAAGTAYHDGEGALGLTLRKTADNGRWSLTGGVAAGTEGDPSVRVGVSGIID